MCGIVALVGSREAAPQLLDGLRQLEYRGYDSAGIATVDATGSLRVRQGLWVVTIDPGPGESMSVQVVP